MTWFRETKLSWFQTFCAKVLKSGTIPKHVAFIMDGNRRFAHKHHIDALQGHVQGFEKLAETLQWCKKLGITEVTVYAFSIENFKRSKQEVDGIMEIAREKFESLLQEKDKIMENGVCIRAFGNFSLLPADIQKMLAEVVLLSCNNNKAFLNVCVSYTSREEICHAVKEMSLGAEKGLILPEDISEDILQKCLYSAASPNPDLVIRTSGEIRLSDFLLWQSAYSVLAFVDVLWPEFTIWSLFGAILYYQIHSEKTMEYKALAEANKERVLHDHDFQCALKEHHECSSVIDLNSSVTEEEVDKCRKMREERIMTFLNHISNKRFERFKDMREGKCVQVVT